MPESLGNAAKNGGKREKGEKEKKRGEQGRSNERVTVRTVMLTGRLAREMSLADSLGSLHRSLPS
jgi:uncharacterized protein YigA (DUF484 family)